MTTSSDPFAEGRKAHDSGKPETVNPYPEDTDDHLSWNDGWQAGADEGDGIDGTVRVRLETRSSFRR